MDENKEFLTYLYQTVQMGISSTTQLLRLLNNRENKIVKLLENELKEYETALKKTEELMEKKDISTINIPPIAKISSKLSINMNIAKDNSDSKIADMLIQGSTMGILEITRKLKKYKTSIDKDISKLAEEINMFQNKNIKKLQKYL